MSIANLLRSRFLRDSATLQAGSLCLALGNLLGVVALSHVLGAHTQGELYLAVAIHSLLWFLTSLALGTVTIGQVARATQTNDSKAVAAWLGHLGRVTAVLALGTIAIAWLVFPAGARSWLGSSVSDPDEIATNAALLCLGPLIEVPRLVALAGLSGTRRMASVARIENGHEACRVVLVVVGAVVTGTARGPVFGMLCASALGSLLAVEAWLRESRAGYLPGPTAVLRSIGALPWREGLGEGFQMGVVRNINIYASQILPAIILGRFGAPAWVAYLRVAQRFTDVPRMLMGGIGRTSLPVLAALDPHKDRARLQSLYVRASLLSGALVGAGLLTVLALAPLITDALLPQDFLRPVLLCLWILSPGVFVIGFSVVNDVFYLLTETLGAGIRLCLLGLLINTTLMTVLASQWPEEGVAYGLSFTIAWSFVHVLYAAHWFRHNRPA